MSAQAIEQFRAAYKSGQRYYNDCIAKGLDPYPVVLDDVCSESLSSAKVDLGVMDIPIDSIVGTIASGRKAAFAGNFMPLLGQDTEFGAKWISLCDHHLSSSGINEAIICMEYMGRFYVQEGHKRVSVLKSFGAPTISAHVMRIVPTLTEDPEVQAYYEFMDFYKLSHVYQMQFRRPGCYARLQASLGFAPDHVWTREEQTDFLGLYWKLREACDAHLLEQVRSKSLSEAMLACLEVYPYAELQHQSVQELKKSVTSILPDLRFAAEDEPTAVSTEPGALPEKSLVGRILEGIARPTLNVAFVHASDPETSTWSRGHDLGRLRLETVFGSQVKVRSYLAAGEDVDQLMEKAVQEGAQLLIATAPTLLAAARRAAAKHPQLMVLVCALSVPYASVRTYYPRIYEAKFVSGALAGVMCGDSPIGYIARYPILGVPASVNAFALGARMTNPNARILLDWSCVAGDPVERLRQAGVRLISGHPVAAHDHKDGRIGWSTAMVTPEGDFRPLACDLWNWGKLYEQIVQGILAGNWKSLDNTGNSAINYWWGMNSGVMNVRLAKDLPVGITQLAAILKDGLKANTLNPFHTVIRDQQGVVRNDGEQLFSAEEIMRMNWLCDNVEGALPDFDQLLPMSRDTTALLAIPRDEPARDNAENEAAPKETEEPASEAPAHL